MAVKLKIEIDYELVVSFLSLPCKLKKKITGADTGPRQASALYTVPSVLLGYYFIQENETFSILVWDLPPPSSSCMHQKFLLSLHSFGLGLKEMRLIV